MSEKKFFMVKNARCSFPDVFDPPIIDGQTGKRGTKMLLDHDEHAPVLKEINEEINSLIKSELKGAKVPADRRCLKNGDDMTQPEYEGYMLLSANTPTQPHVMKPRTRQKAETQEESGIYSGCYVDAKISLWAQNNKYGKRINARLIAIRFAGDGEPFSTGHVSEEEAVDGFEVSDGDDFFEEAA